MTEILFYHLTRSPLENALPELLEKSLHRGWRAVVRGRNAERLEWLDRKLWRGGDAFLPHGLAGGPHDAAQPVLLTMERSAPNQPDILFAVDDAEIDPGEVAGYQRVCVMFDGNDEGSLNRARELWRVLTGASLPARYWSEEAGAWRMKASKNV